MRTAELTGAALAWAVGLAEGYELSLYGVDPSIRARVPGLGVYAPWRPDWHWNQGGVIIDREFICLSGDDGSPGTPPSWTASIFDDGELKIDGPTALVAAMRCFVAYKLGADVDLPEELK